LDEHASSPVAAVCSQIDAEFHIPHAAAGIEASAACFDVDVVSTTGAGDCTIAGFLAARIRGASLEQQLEQACAVGACSCEAADATRGVITTAAMQSRVNAGWRRRLSIFDALG
jgi:sugar/nucleoside kinase (ribokinase family)